jgi:hypothetical protein
LEDLLDEPLPATQGERLLEGAREHVSPTIVWRSEEPQRPTIFQRPAKRYRQIPFSGPGSSPRNPSAPIFPSLATRILHRPAPSMENPDEPWFGDLQLDSSTTLVVLLQKGRTQDNPKELLFEAIYEGLTSDWYWGLYTYPIHLIDHGVGHNRWLYGQPRLLPRDQRRAHVVDVVQHILRFMKLP